MDKHNPTRRPVTVADVARAAQVSKATAARALGGYGAVRADLKERILEAAQRLDYRPNELARTMATGRSGTIGVIVGDIENPFFGLAVRGISDVAAQAGFDVILSNSGETLATEKASTEVFLSKRVDGLIVAPATRHDGSHLRDALARGCPLVLLDRDVPGLPVDVALVDDHKAAREATQLLLAAGHRRLAYITATAAADAHYSGPDQIPLTTVLNRIAGFLEASDSAGLAETERQIRLDAAKTARSQAILLDLLRAPGRPTALLASDSKIALEVFRAARTLGLHIPGDLSLVSFDDADWTSAVSPLVSVVSQPSYDLGAAAAQMLVARIVGGKAPPRRHVLDTVLIQRESVAPPRS
ncbi:LacI family DNA-binding transcriptional regulator [Labrys sp. ZIDIC5]|uniref:LacI family DNA-binding transcriptional regulator n=1 Tax=Labrys sedimenti TaxID=3106036 RepID=UPI002ACA7B13|nr:LacI family DNA-binding transcriptional regulator [Labrys sp. ZIDIC5]MDZ5449309.1 LacI family DNA-binding transcriptional regulator [Labrys sp. ZIDIC5]